MQRISTYSREHARPHRLHGCTASQAQSIQEDKVAPSTPSIDLPLCIDLNEAPARSASKHRWLPHCLWHGQAIALAN